MMDFFTGMFWGFIAGVVVTGVAATFVVWWEISRLNHPCQEEEHG